MATKKRVRSAADDERKGRSRFVDQPGQWVSTASPSFKKKKEKEWKKFEEMMKTTKGKKKK